MLNQSSSSWYYACDSIVYGDAEFGYNCQCNATFKEDSDIVGLGVSEAVLIVFMSSLKSNCRVNIWQYRNYIDLFCRWNEIESLIKRIHSIRIGALRFYYYRMDDLLRQHNRCVPR